MAVHLDPYGFLNARYACAHTILIRAMPRGDRIAHTDAMIAWVIAEGAGEFTYMNDTHGMHWTTLTQTYDVSLDDWMKSRGTHEMFLFTDINTAFAFKMRFA